MPLWWRAGRSTVAVRSARLPSMDGGRVGAVQSGAPLEALARATRSTHRKGRTGCARGRRKDRREDRRYPAATRRTAHADAPLSMGHAPLYRFFIGPSQRTNLKRLRSCAAWTYCHFPVPPARSNSRPFAVHRAVRAPWWERALCSRLTCARANLLLQPRTARPKTSTVPCASPCSEACDWLARPPIASPPLSAASGAHRSAHTPTVH